MQSTHASKAIQLISTFEAAWGKWGYLILFYNCPRGGLGRPFQTLLGLAFI